MDAHIDTLQLASQDTPLPEELLEQIFTYWQLPSATIIRRYRYETYRHPSTLNTPPDEQEGFNHELDDYIQECLRTLNAICKSSKRFNKVAMPILYRVYPGHSHLGRVNNSIGALFRTLQRKPALGDLIKEVVMDLWVPTDGTAAEQEDWARCLPQLGLGERFLAKMQREAHHRPDAQMALLFLRCTKLETLEPAAPLKLTQSILTPLFRELQQQRPNTVFRAEGGSSDVVSDLPLRHLRTLTIRFADPNHSPTIQPFHSLIRLATIESLTVYRLSGGLSYLSDLKALQSLTLWRCDYHGQRLHAALRTCFVPDDGETDDLPEHRGWLNYLGDIIRKHHPTLQTLRLDPRNIKYNSPRASIGSLADLHELKHLALPDYALMYRPGIKNQIDHHRLTSALRRDLVETLPRSLQKLSILCERLVRGAAKPETHDSEWHQVNEGQIVALLQDPHFAALRDVHIDLMTPFTTQLEGWRAEMVYRDEEVCRPSAVFPTMGPVEEFRFSYDLQQIRDNVSTFRLRTV